MKSYRQYLKAIGRKPLRGPLRTKKRAGDVELVWDARVGDWVTYRHPEAKKPEGNVVPIKRRAVR